MQTKVKRPKNLEEIRALFEALPFGSRIKIAKKYGFSPKYVTHVTKVGNEAYNYQIIKEAVKHLPEELRERAVLKF